MGLLGVCSRLEDGPELVDAIVICTPTVTHADQIRTAAARVKDIFVEQPLAHTLQEATAIHDFARKQGLCVQVGFKKVHTIQATCTDMFVHRELAGVAASPVIARPR